MLAFGETVERTPKEFASERTRIKRGKVLGRRRSIEVIQTKESLVLPNITTTQLTQNCEMAGTGCKETREAMNGQTKKPVQQIAKRGRLRDSTFMLEENGGIHGEDLEGMFISKLSFQNESRDNSPEVFSSGCSKKQRKQHTRLSKTDSGFCEDSTDGVVSPNFVDSPNESDKASNTSNSSSSPTSPDHSASNRVSRREKTRKITVDFKTFLNRDKTVVRNTDRLTTKPSMCVQSQQSLHVDLVAFKSLSTHKGTTPNCNFQTNEPCVKLREVVLKTRRNSFDCREVKQSDTSLAVLKTRRRLLGKRNSTGAPFPFTERRVKKELGVVDMRRATCNCEQRRVQFSNLERLDANRHCVSCPVDFVPPQLNQERITMLDNENRPDLVGDAASTSSLTEQALFEASRSQETVDVNVKCQEWLNRWLAFNSAPQPSESSTTVA